MTLCKKMILTIRRNRSPTESSPCPPSITDPRAISSSSVNISANKAISVMLLKIIFVSSGVIGGPSEAVDESDDVDTVREDDPDEFGGEAGMVRGPVKPEKRGTQPKLVNGKVTR